MGTDNTIEEEMTRVTQNGQVAIPQKFREAYGLDAGDEVVWRDNDDGILVRKGTRSSARGMLVPDDTPAETRENIGEKLDERIHDLRERRESRLLDEVSE